MRGLPPGVARLIMVSTTLASLLLVPAWPWHWRWGRRRLTSHCRARRESRSA